MFDEYQICPYTGLRSFTEEESLYFKGRDEHIDQATKQLEENRFLMLTGASGDGKSSLVYAGIVPNARAGFLKSWYPNWSVVSFRPERSPFHNLCQSVAQQLGIENVSTVESELEHGFSALVDLYKNSSLYLDKAAPSSADPEAQRKSSNLIILADQFEEFFTNPENYHKGIPSQESSLVVNLLLETGRIAYDQNLPIYVVCTMRSDYIGQCAAFRGLPEAIGFSQFFVPRLNRKLLQEVIEEPAMLSGNRITKRLVDRLIHDLTEGVDQLPILQHALNQIWKAADQGNEEMDLIHYAMVGGMAGDELPAEDASKFSQWFSDLPQKIRQCYDRPRLQNVINTHANKLYAIAADHHNQRTQDFISDEQAQQIIKVTFICLTKIDQSRAVRNRMMLQEIADILAQPEIGTKTVAGVLQVFRESGNTFVKPFLEEGDANDLPVTTVLDITHESLIRNWELLNQWAYQEFDFYNTFLDFKQSLDRWLESGRSKGFLLPIGSLTYFEDWYGELKPSKFWIKRYQEEDKEPEQKIKESEETLKATNDFIRQSARRHRVTRTIMKYGPARIAAVTAILLVISLSSFFYLDSYSRRNEVIMDSWKQESLRLLQDDKVNLDSKAVNLILNERLEPGSMEKTLHELPAFPRLSLSIAAASDLLAYSKGKDHPLVGERIRFALEAYKNPDVIQALTSKEHIMILNDMVRLLQYYDYYHPSLERKELLTFYATQLGNQVVIGLQKEPDGEWDISEVNSAIELSLNHNGLKPDQVATLLSILSPFEGARALDLYDLQSQWEVGFNSSFSSNGLFQELAYLYAAQGQVELSLRCLDSVSKYHPDYESFSDNSYNVATYLLNQADNDLLSNFVTEYCARRGLPLLPYLHRYMDHAGLLSFYSTSSLRVAPAVFFVQHNPNLEMLAPEGKERLFEFFHNYLIQSIRDPNELNFNLALHYKKWGVGRLRPGFHSRSEIDPGKSELLQKSLEFYQRIDPEYLEEIINVNFSTQSVPLPRKHQYLYPDLLPQVAPYEPRTRWTYYDSDIFLEFLLDNKLITELYKDKADLSLFDLWASYYVLGREWDLVLVNVGTETIGRLDTALMEHPMGDNSAREVVKLLLCHDYFANGQVINGKAYLQQLDPTSIRNIFSSVGDWNLIKQIVMNMVLRIHQSTLRLGLDEEAERLISDVKNPKNKASFYAYSSAHFYLAGQPELGKDYLDKAVNEAAGDSPDQLFNYDPSKLVLGFAYASQGTQEAQLLAKQQVKNLNYSTKTRASALMASALTRQDQFHLAQTSFPDYISRDTRLNAITEMLFAVDRERGIAEGWEEYDHYRFLFSTGMVFFEVDEL